MYLKEILTISPPILLTNCSSWISSLYYWHNLPKIHDHIWWLVLSKNLLINPVLSLKIGRWRPACICAVSCVPRGRVILTCSLHGAPGPLLGLEGDPWVCFLGTPVTCVWASGQVGQIIPGSSMWPSAGLPCANDYILVLELRLKSDLLKSDLFRTLKPALFYFLSAFFQPSPLPSWFHPSFFFCALVTFSLRGHYLGQTQSYRLVFKESRLTFRSMQLAPAGALVLGWLTSPCLCLNILR